MYDKIKVGEVYPSNRGGDFTVVEVYSSQKIKIKFNDKYGQEKITSPEKIFIGGISNSYAKTCFGVGFIGEGIFNSSIKNEHIGIYRIWSGMMSRGYSENWKGLKPTYADVVVCEEWHNLQVFGEWILNHPFYGLGYHLDKDLLFKGNRLYSPNTCTLIPDEINIIFKSYNVKNRKVDLPRCVDYEESSGMFRVNGSLDGKAVYVGRYKTVCEAERAALDFEQRRWKHLVNKWEGKVEDKVIDKIKILIISSI